MPRQCLAMSDLCRSQRPPAASDHRRFQWFASMMFTWWAETMKSMANRQSLRRKEGIRIEFRIESGNRIRVKDFTYHANLKHSELNSAHLRAMPCNAVQTAWLILQCWFIGLQCWVTALFCSSSRASVLLGQIRYNCHVSCTFRWHSEI